MQKAYVKPYVKRHAKATTCRTHGKPCVHMHVNGEVYKMGYKSVHRGGEEQKGKEGKKEKKEKKKKEKEKKGREKEKEKEIGVPTVRTCRTKK